MQKLFPRLCIVKSCFFFYLPNVIMIVGGKFLFVYCLRYSSFIFFLCPDFEDLFDDEDLN